LIKSIIWAKNTPLTGKRVRIGANVMELDLRTVPMDAWSMMAKTTKRTTTKQLFKEHIGKMAKIGANAMELDLNTVLWHRQRRQFNMVLIHFGQ